MSYAPLERPRVRGAGGGLAGVGSSVGASASAPASAARGSGTVGVGAGGTEGSSSTTLTQLSSPRPPPGAGEPAGPSLSGCPGSTPASAAQPLVIRRALLKRSLSPLLLGRQSSRTTSTTTKVSTATAPIRSMSAMRYSL